MKFLRKLFIELNNLKEEINKIINDKAGQGICSSKSPVLFLSNKYKNEKVKFLNGY